tara:strand:- start:486 stop:1133 length:648 start_codon:yes stop_codon:yes gene_type:complete
MIPENCKAIIFDMDGVLWKSSKIHYKAFCDTLKDEKLKPPSYKYIAGKRTDDVMKEICREQIKKYDHYIVQRLIEKKQKLAREELQKNPPVAKNCIKTLKKLSTKYTLALATSGSSENVKTFLSFTGLENIFKSIISGDDVESAKPDPEIYLLTVKRLNLTANECLVVEDSLNGIMSAHNAGVKSIAITGTHKQTELSSSSSIFIINNLIELCQE